MAEVCVFVFEGSYLAFANTQLKRLGVEPFLQVLEPDSSPTCGSMAISILTCFNRSVLLSSSACANVEANSSFAFAAV